MRVLLLLLTIGVGVASAQIATPIYPPSSTPRFDRVSLPWGWFGPYNNNEIAVVSQVGDPPGYWVASREGTSLGFHCFGRERSDGRLECLVLIQGKQDERTRGLGHPYNLTGELTIHIRDGSRGGGDDAQFVKVGQLRHDGYCLVGSDRPC